MTRDGVEFDAFFTLTGGDFNPVGRREVQMDDKTFWVDVRDREDLRRKLQGVRLLGGSVSLIPRLREDRYFFLPSSVVWARLETGAAAEALADFEPKPTMVLQDGDTVRRTALWWLSAELDTPWLLKANERLCAELGGVRKAAGPHFMVVPPGAGSGVQTVHVAQLTLGLHDPDAIVGAKRPGGPLADAPDLDRLRRRHAERRDMARRQAVAA